MPYIRRNAFSNAKHGRYAAYYNYIKGETEELSSSL